MNNIYTISKKLNYSTETQTSKSKVDHIISIIKSKMDSLGFEYREYSSFNCKNTEYPHYVFSVGGDGTMMHSMHNYVKHASVIVGINAGNVGFLTPFSVEDLDDHLFNLISSPNQRIEFRTILKHSFKKTCDYAINEFAITGNGPNDMLDFSIEIQHHHQNSKAGRYKANAVLVSGPCGSTAYNMNAGGAIVDPSVKCMQILMIAPTTLGSRPIILGKNTTVNLFFHKKAKVFSDGILIHEIEPNESHPFSITLMPKESKILVPEDWNFYSVLSKKLHWNNGKDVG